MKFAEWLDGQLNPPPPHPKIRQVEFAKTLGVSPTTVSFWINGKTEPDDRQLDSLVDYFGKDKAFFLRLLGKLDNDHPISARAIALIQEADEIARGFTDPEMRQIVTDDLAQRLEGFKSFAETLHEIQERIRLTRKDDNAEGSAADSSQT